MKNSDAAKAWYYLSIASHPLDSTKFADSSYFDTVGEVEEFLIHNYPARDSMWVTTCPVDQVFDPNMPEVVSCWQDGDSPRWGRIVRSSIKSIVKEEKSAMLKFHLSTSQLAKIRKALFEQGKIYAIKECREITGWGLKDAKDAIEMYCYRLECDNRGTFPFDFSFGNASTGTNSAELILPDAEIGLSSLVIQLTGNRTAELNGSDKIDIITTDGNHRFSIDEIRMIVKLWDATRFTNN